MSDAWAAWIPMTEARAAARLRSHRRVEVCEDQARLWLRAHHPDEALLTAALTLPAVARYSVMPDGRIRPAGGRTPVGRLPEGKWVPLSAWSVPKLPVAALPGLAGRANLRLVRSSREEAPSALVTGASGWLRYATSAPQIRLRGLSFAVGESGRVLVRGLPLPPLEGGRFVAKEGVAVPCGYTWAPAVDAAVVAEALGLKTHDLALFSPDGSWELVPADAFVPATRSAARASLEDGHGR